MTWHDVLLASMGCGLGCYGAFAALLSGDLPLDCRILGFQGLFTVGILSLLFLVHCIQELTRRSDL
ncbi:hypothetical protein [Streptomyces sp. NPDC058308]|uniref:hypothetical protein n=1 Tax=Streptomyces sp. NPDC058308 TaxID=3346440 RepID=UPI0036EB417F